jgi:hypothetical protein
VTPPVVEEMKEVPTPCIGDTNVFNDPGTQQNQPELSYTSSSSNYSYSSSMVGFQSQLSVSATDEQQTHTKRHEALDTVPEQEPFYNPQFPQPDREEIEPLD